MTDSPFTPEGWQFVWDSTSLGWYKNCPRQYQYYMVEGWKPNSGSVHLEFGIYYHKGIELYYKAMHEGRGHAEALRIVVRYALEATWDTEKNLPWVTDHTKNRQTLIRTLVWYLEEFGLGDPAQTLILDDGKLAVELSFKLNAGEFMLSGHLDRLVEFVGQKYVMDHKTTTQTLSPYYFKQYSPDNQMSLYSLAAEITYHTPVAGVIVDAAQIAVGFSRFERGFASRTKTQLQEWMDDFHYWADRARRDRLADHFPMNDKACFNCAFREVCSSSPQVRGNILKTHFRKDPWNPLENR